MRCEGIVLTEYYLAQRLPSMPMFRQESQDHLIYQTPGTLPFTKRGFIASDIFLLVRIHQNQNKRGQLLLLLLFDLKLPIFYH